jgi:hypothetical protein
MMPAFSMVSGDTASAIEHYEKFLDLWKDVDPVNFRRVIVL